MNRISSCRLRGAASTMWCFNDGLTDSGPTGQSASNHRPAGFAQHLVKSFLKVSFDGESVRIASIRELGPEEEEDLLIRYGKLEPEFEQTPAPQEVKGAEVEELDTAAED